GDYIFAGHYNGSVSIYSCTESGQVELVVQMRGHTHSVMCLAFGNGRLLSGGRDRQLIDWDWYGSGLPRRHAQYPSFRFQSLTIVGDALVAICDDSTIRVYSEELVERSRLSLDSIQAFDVHNHLLVVSVAKDILVYSLASLVDKGAEALPLVRFTPESRASNLSLGSRYLVASHIDGSGIYLLRNVLDNIATPPGMFTDYGRLSIIGDRLYLTGNRNTFGYFSI
ncbi:hypothetical protein HDU91_004163, partial [Kappamyces sp. JEL0680]